MAKQLNVKQKTFCLHYVSGKGTVGNGVQSYALAYDYNISTKAKYKSAKSNAHRLLQNPSITAYIDELLEDQKVDERLVNRHLWLFITQNENPTLKLQAITTYLRSQERQPGLLGHKQQRPLTLQEDFLQSLESIKIDPEEEAQIETYYDAIEELASR